MSSDNETPKNINITLIKLAKENAKLKKSSKELGLEFKKAVKAKKEAEKIAGGYKKVVLKYIEEDIKNKKKIADLRLKIKNAHSTTQVKGPWGTVTNTHDIYPENFNIIDSDLKSFFIEVKPVLSNIITGVKSQYENFKIQCILAVECTLPTGVVSTFHIYDSNNEKAHIVYKSQSSNDVAKSIINNLNDNFENHSGKGSGYMFKKVLMLRVNVYKTFIKKGASYFETPKCIANKKCVINVKNNDEKCFLWAVLSALYPAESHSDRLSKYKPYENQLDTSMLEYPVKCDARVYKKFEEKNNLSISVYDYKCKDCEVIPSIIYNSKANGKHINLLLIHSDDKSHYVWIKDFSSFCASTNNHGQKHYCRYCLHGFTNEELLTKHLDNGCMLLNDEEKPVMPVKGVNDKISFKNVNNQFKHPFTIYADFESILENVDEKKGCGTTVYQKHTCCSYAYKIVSNYDGIEFPLKMFRGENADANFLKDILQVSDELFTIICKNTKMIISDEQEKKHKKAKECHICHKKFTKDDKKVRDHDHISGLYVGAGHSKCNFDRQNRRLKIPVVFHNLKNYDAHFIIKQCANLKQQIDIITNSSEKYLSFTIGKLRFIDSFAFMSSSLEKLVNNLGDINNFKLLRKEFNFFKNDDHNLNNVIKLMYLKQKGVYPYDYMDDFKRFEESNLPSKLHFYSKMNKEEITDYEYKRATKVWESFDMKSLGDYHDLYLKTDVLLLADVFENFRDISIKMYGLDPVYYVSAPSLSWDAMLLKTNASIELLTDIDMYNTVSNGIRGGISMISHRYAEANNKYMKAFDENKEKSYIWYSDANNLYGCAMSWALPLNNFKYDDVNKYTEEYIMSKKKDDAEGCIIEVDLEYPEELHDAHNCYPLAPERMAVGDNMLSDYAKSLKEKFDLTTGKVEKLVPNLKNKEKYICDYRNLQLYLSLGLKMGKVHQVISYHQSFWLKEYIDFNTKMRKSANNDFEKDFYKLMINSVFGKTMENVKNRIDFRLCNDKEKFQKHINDCRFKSSVCYDDENGLYGIRRMRKAVLLNKPIIVGMCVLDVSKHIMYDFHYNTMKPLYNENLKLLFTDTDSLCYHIKTEDLYKDLYEMKEKLDLSGHKLICDLTNNKVYGKFKDESGGIPITHFCGERAKCYAYVTDEMIDNELEHKKLKGIKKSVVKNEMQFLTYKQSVLEETIKRKKMNTIRSYKHNLVTIETEKIALCPFDDKRYLLNSVDSLAYGHYKIK